MKSARNPRLPAGWSEARVADVIAHYETQSEDEALTEDEAALSDRGRTVMVIPTHLVPAVRKLLASTGTYASALRNAIELYRFPPLLMTSLMNLVLHGSTIPITAHNEFVYGEWASWCRDTAASVNAESGSGESIRAVDVERAVFAVADVCDRTEALRLLRGPCAEDRTGQVRDEEIAG